jgi:signal peptide peptidase SppA
MKASLERVASRISGTPLMITERKLDVILNVLAPRIGVEAPQVNMSALGEEATARRYEVHQGVAVVPVVGTLLHRSDWLDAESGLVSYGAIGDMIETAVGDPHVHHIVLDVDSSGGEANGVFDQVDRIYKMRGEKPITAVVNEEANSAAYAIASAADRIVTTRTALSGSIGVIATHVDQSNYNESEGLKVTHVYAGERKADYTPHAPLSDEAQQRLQEQVNETYDIFVETVARNRGMRERAVRDTRAAFFLGRAAVVNGLADAVDTVEAVVQRAKQERGNPMSNSTASSTRRGASSGGRGSPARSGH